MLRLALLIAISVFIPLAAFANDTASVTAVVTGGAEPGFTVHAGDFLAWLAAAVFGVLGTFIAFVAHKALDKLQEKTGIEIDEKHRAVIDAGLQKAVDYAKVKLSDKARNLGDFNIQSEFISTAANYALDSIPDALEHFGIDVPQLEKMLQARLAAHLNG